ncbi:MAG TPA: carboxylesterase family protein [Steroidobacteraceae bacterium]|nr:carboxylesterase family protein [Steroidobacteraceae bacterium]
MSTFWNRREIISIGAAAAGLSLLPDLADAKLSLSTIPAAPYVKVETASGWVRGGHCRGALVFKGIPYAGDVSGANRFKAPPPLKPWQGVFDATHLGPPTLQRPKNTYGEQEPAPAEDCLVLNVWTPAVNDHRKRPVMFYIHGGGYVTGSGGSPTQDGSRLAATYDVIVVACNHRLGLMGYLYLGDLDPSYASDANAGMQDIVAALNWVKTNIAAFGGDPHNVTIFGESGGGGKVATLMAMPQAAGLYHKAGIESGAWLTRMNKDVATETALRLLKALNIPSKELLRLTEVPAQTLLDLQIEGEDHKGPLMNATDPANPIKHNPADDESPGHFAPLVDGKILPVQPFDPAAPALAAHVPLMIGSNHDEATFFFRDQPEIFSMNNQQLVTRLLAQFGDNADRVLTAYHKAMPDASPSEIFIAIATARSVGFGNDTITLASRKSAQPAAVYLYRYDYESNFPVAGTSSTLRAGHATDIGPTFLNYDEPGLHGNGPGVAQTSRNLSALWTSFARTGKPSARGVPEWPRYNTHTRPTMLVNTACHVVDDPNSDIREMWASL